MIPAICNLGIPAALHDKAFHIMSLMLDAICTPQEVLYIAKALLPLNDNHGMRPYHTPTLFSNNRGLVVLAKLVEQLVNFQHKVHAAIS